MTRQLSHFRSWQFVKIQAFQRTRTGQEATSQLVAIFEKHRIQAQSSIRGEEEQAVPRTILHFEK